MILKGALGSGNPGLLAAVRRFPAHAFAIEEMTASDEDFRGLCDDLGAAESALRAIDQLPEALRAERRKECESWIESLTEEIEGALRREKVVAIGARRTRPSEA